MSKNLFEFLQNAAEQSPNQSGSFDPEFHKRSEDIVSTSDDLTDKSTRVTEVIDNDKEIVPSKSDKANDDLEDDEPLTKIPRTDFTDTEGPNSESVESLSCFIKSSCMSVPVTEQMLHHQERCTDKIASNVQRSLFSASEPSSDLSNKNIWTQLGFQPLLDHSSSLTLASEASALISSQDSQADTAPRLSPIPVASSPERCITPPQLQPSISTVDLNAKEIDNVLPSDYDKKELKTDLCSNKPFVSESLDVDATESLDEALDNASNAPEVSSEKLDVSINDDSKKFDPSESDDKMSSIVIYDISNDDPEEICQIPSASEKNETDADTESNHSETNDLVIALPADSGNLNEFSSEESNSKRKEISDESFSDQNSEKSQTTGSNLELREGTDTTISEMSCAIKESSLTSENISKSPNCKRKEANSEDDNSQTSDIGELKSTNVDTRASSDTTKSTSNQVSFFEKVATFFGTNLLESNVLLSPPSKSVFGSFVSEKSDDEKKSEKNEATRIMKDIEVEAVTENVSVKANETTSPQPSTLPRNPCDFYLESCSVNELLMKEEEEQEQEEAEVDGDDFDDRMCESGNDSVNGKSGNSSEKVSLLSKVVDRLLPTETDSRLSTLSKRLRNRMPYWDDAFNDAFVPQIRGKAPHSSNTVSNITSYGSETSKRQKSTYSSPESHNKCVADDLLKVGRDCNTFVPPHVKKVRQFLTSLNVSQGTKGDDCVEVKPNENNPQIHNLRLGNPSPNPKATLRAKKVTYHDTKKALRMPPKLVRNLPSPTLKKAESESSNVQASATNAAVTTIAVPVEFRSSLGASVRTKPRAFTKAALRRQIAEEASTATPQFRVKTRPAPDGGTGPLAIVITRVNRPPPSNRSSSTSSDKLDELKENSGDGESNDAEVTTAEEDDFSNASVDMKMEKKETPLDSTDNVSQSVKKDYTSDDNSEPNRKRQSDALEVHGESKRSRHDSDGSILSSDKDGSKMIPNLLPQSQSPSSTSNSRPSISGRQHSATSNQSDDGFEDDSSGRDSVNFRGVASNRKRLKSQKHRLLLEIENTSGFIMDRNRGDTREQRAVQRLLHSMFKEDVHQQKVTNLGRKEFHRSTNKVARKKAPKKKKLLNESELLEAHRDCKKRNISLGRSNQPTQKCKAANKIAAKYRDERVRVQRKHIHIPSSVNPSVAGVLRRLDGKDMYGRTAVHVAAELGHLESVNFCIQSPIEMHRNVDVQDNSGMYPIHAAACSGNVRVIMALIDAGADVNICGGATGLRPIHEAARLGNADAIKALLSRGADLSLTTYDGTTAVDYAKNSEIRHLLETYKDGKVALCPIKIGKSVECDGFTFTLSARNPPLSFRFLIGKRWFELMLLSELSEFSNIPTKRLLRLKTPKICVVKLSVAVLHKGMQNHRKWPALLLRLRTEKNLRNWQDLREVKNTTVPLVINTSGVQRLIGGVYHHVDKHTVELDCDPPPAIKMPRSVNRYPLQDMSHKSRSRHISTSSKQECDNGDYSTGVHENSEMQKDIKLSNSSVKSCSRRCANDVRSEFQWTMSANNNTLDSQSQHIRNKNTAVRSTCMTKGQIGTFHDTSLQLPIASPSDEMSNKINTLSYGNGEKSLSDDDVIITGVVGPMNRNKRPHTKPSKYHQMSTNETTFKRKHNRPVASVLPNLMSKHRQCDLQSETPTDMYSDSNFKLERDLIEEAERLKAQRKDLERRERMIRETLQSLPSESPESPRYNQRGSGIIDNLQPLIVQEGDQESFEQLNSSSSYTNLQPTIVEVQPQTTAPVPYRIPANNVNLSSDFLSPLEIDIPDSPLKRALSGNRTPIELDNNLYIHNDDSILQHTRTGSNVIHGLPYPNSIQMQHQNQSLSNPKVIKVRPSRIIGVSPGSMTVQSAATKPPVSFSLFKDRMNGTNKFVKPSLLRKSFVNDSSRRNKPLILKSHPQPGRANVGPQSVSTVKMSENHLHDPLSDDIGSPSGSPPLLIPQKPTTTQPNLTCTPIAQHSAPPLLYPQEPPVLLPCPELVDQDFTLNDLEINHLEDDVPPPTLFEPASRQSQTASEFLKQSGTDISTTSTAPSPHLSGATTEFPTYSASKPGSKKKVGYLVQRSRKSASSKPSEKRNVKCVNAVFQGETASTVTVAGKQISQDGYTIHQFNPSKHFNSMNLTQDKGCTNIPSSSGNSQKQRTSTSVSQKRFKDVRTSGRPVPIFVLESNCENENDRIGLEDRHCLPIDLTGMSPPSLPIQEQDV